MPIKIIEHINIATNPHRDLHGPSVIRAANGDLLLCHQDSDQHHGGQGFTHQWRSQNKGVTWQDEGPVADWRNRKLDALFGEYGLAANGRLVMMIQRRKVASDNKGILDTWLQTSDDHGKTWQEQGPVDTHHKYAVMMGRNLITQNNILYAGVWSRLGNALYVSTDHGLSWQKRSMIFPTDYTDFSDLKNAGPPYYPHVIFCPNNTLLAMTYHTPPRHHCYTRRSTDNGKTWEPIKPEKNLPLWAPRMKQFDAKTLIVTGRDIEEKATVAYFSTDSGHTWANKLILDKPKFSGSYAYTDSMRTDQDTFWVFTSSPQSAGKGDIIGILLKTENP